MPPKPEIEHQNLETLTNWILAQQKQAPEARGSLSILLNQLSVACKFVESSVRKAGLAGMLGLAGSENVQGEDQKKLDVLADDVFVNVLTRCGQCAVLVSEEQDDPIIIPEGQRGEYVVVFDPLDGSSNIDCAVSVGTIFGIWRRPTERQGKPGNIQDALRVGSEQVCAGYCLYGSSCVMVISIGDAPSAFTLDQNIGDFVMTQSSLSIPPQGKIYSINEGNAQYWDPPTKKYVEECKFPGGNGKPKSARYVGSMVADVHRTILYGGIFAYPSDSKTKNGKLRLLYECFPMAYLVEHAQGRAVTGRERILDILPTDIHERRPIFLGSAKDVERVERLYNE